MDRSRLVTVSALLLMVSVGLGSWLSAGGQQGSPEVSIAAQNAGRIVLDITVPGLEARLSRGSQRVDYIPGREAAQTFMPCFEAARRRRPPPNRQPARCSRSRRRATCRPRDRPMVIHCLG